MTDDTGELYLRTRQKLLAQSGTIVGIEKKYMSLLSDAVLKSAPKIFSEFNLSAELKPFWQNYAPQPRGYKPRGNSIPWGEVGEKTVGANILQQILAGIPSLAFIGLPFGGDIRFATQDAVIHFDIKMTGPNDNPDEVVASPYQISGDGSIWNEKGMANREIKVVGPRKPMAFRPELPPFYFVGSTEPKPCLIFFLKVVYDVESLGVQPLKYLEIVSIPNGLLLFDGPRLAKRRGLLIPGKDERHFSHKRVRVRLDPLVDVDSWRTRKVEPDTAGVYSLKPRREMSTS